MKIEKFVIGIISTNCYLVINEESKEAVIIDPAAAPNYFLEHIKSEGLSLKAILLTHGHFDHIMGLEALLQEYDVPVYAYGAEQELLGDGTLNQSKPYTGGYTFTGATSLKDKQELQLAGYRFQVLHTPGHTAGSVCYYVAEEQVLFSGDTLFLGSVGRTDLPTGNTAALKKSVREQLLVLPEEVVVYPGHMAETTIAHEREINPYA